MRAFVGSESVPRLWICFIGLRRKWNRYTCEFAQYFIDKSLQQIFILECRPSAESTWSITSKRRITRWSDGSRRILSSELRRNYFWKALTFHFRIHRYDRRHQHTHPLSNLHIRSQARQLTIKWCRINLSWVQAQEDM